MPSSSQNDSRTAKIVDTKEDLALLLQHLKDVTEGADFRGSHRSGQFLKYVVEQAIAGHFECLKERVIGVELFGRSPSYDTGDDAIVRVTASDVRKRLLQHYGRSANTSKFRISLPLGSYVPEISCEPRDNATHNLSATPELPTALHDVAASPEPSAEPPIPATTVHPAVQPEVPPVKTGSNRGWITVIFLVTLLNLGVLGISWRTRTQPVIRLASILPWSVLFNSPHAIHLVTSDPNIAEMQQDTGSEISTSDYANHLLMPNPNNMTPEIQHFWSIILRDDTAAFVDSQVAVNIAELAQAYSKHIDVRAARNLQMSDLQTDDNFILMGSPRSDPWSDLFSNQLDFRFFFDKNSGQEIIRNLHPRPHEAAMYVPTALGGATGQSYAIVAFVRNPDQNGQILLLAGANAEGTEAAGRLITNMPRLSAALQQCGISPTSPLQHFELLLKLNTMANSPNNTYVEVCHILPNHL